jgi:hypothetical protein
MQQQQQALPRRHLRTRSAATPSITRFPPTHPLPSPPPSFAFFVSSLNAVFIDATAALIFQARRGYLEPD